MSKPKARPLKANLRVVKETFGTMDKQEAFQKAFEPHFQKREGYTVKAKAN
ncbi:hypothetical protein ACIQLG_00750 [Terribacillus saccharophilus]|uniref:hypothetical protein n=1 Tax=Terribacillus saccharophilus TaxID=361277 RepID=UPI0038009631